jgi:osmotically-inducible protein OsmY
LRNMDVRAEVDDGRVTLIGEVDLLYQKELAAERVAELKDVSAVVNEIKVRERREIEAGEANRGSATAARERRGVGDSSLGSEW